MTPTVSAIYLYPVKSCRGIAVTSAPLNQWGLQYDRNWLIVTAAGRFITQREQPRLALIHTTLTDQQLQLSASGMDNLALPLQAGTGEVMKVEIWRDHCLAVDQGATAADWLSQFLGLDVRLVRMGGQYDRPTNPNYATEAQVSFADAYPLLAISEASLADLNQRLADPIPMNRFRPNLVIAGCEPYAEDQWKKIRVNGVVFDLVKPCDRCVVTTTDQETGSRTGMEPIKTLSTYRRVEKSVFFGQNLVHRGLGQIAVGATVEILV
jgi:uncharacterized protein